MEDTDDTFNSGNTAIILLWEEVVDLATALCHEACGRATRPHLPLGLLGAAVLLKLPRLEVEVASFEKGTTRMQGGNTL